jgi:2,4-dienoyl-CoA reductase-like NADH-dependent reductase (Old Yellow Enzyme family)
VGPSGGESMAWDAESGKGGFWPPRELSEEEVKEVVRAHGESAKLAVQAGVDVIEIHAAHGYLLNEFLSPITNRRTDKYGEALRTGPGSSLRLPKPSEKVCQRACRFS